MKISIFLIYSVAAIALLTLSPKHQSEALGIGGLKSTTTGGELLCNMFRRIYIFRFADVLKLGQKAGSGVIGNITNLIPSPASIINLSKQTLLGLPFEAVLSTVDQLCSIVLAANNGTQPLYNQPKIEDMNYVLLTDKENISIPITESGKLWQHEKFDPHKKVVVMVTGWTSDIDSENSAASALWQAYMARGDTNFVLIDTARYVDTLYAWSAFNTAELGAGLGKGLAELIKYVPLDNIHLMGHSLGAHIAGSAGKTFQMETDKLLPRITGFDPAKPCFKEGEMLQGLGRGDAEFVDVIHSDAGGLGKAEAIGDADFYPNGIVPLMPGCYTIFCSHSRAWEYFAETVMPGNEEIYAAKKCGSLYSFEINACTRKEVIMGFACPKNTKGNFFLKTNSEAPFGLGKQQQRQ